MKQIIFSILVVLVLVLFSFVIKYVHHLILPGRWRLKYKRNIIDKNLLPWDEKMELVIRRVLPEQFRNWLKNKLYQTGQSYEWTVDKAIRMIFIGFLVGAAASLFNIFAFLSTLNFVLLLNAVVAIIIGPLLPLLIFQSERSDFIARIIYQTPEFLDILETELVRGTGDIAIALQSAKDVLTGELRLILEESFFLIEEKNGGINNGLELIKTRINHPIYDQIIDALKQYQNTGKAKKILEILHDSIKEEVEEITKKQTSKKNIYLSIAAVGLLINLGILVGVPLLLTIIDEFSRNPF